MVSLIGHPVLLMFGIQGHGALGPCQLAVINGQKECLQQVCTAISIQLRQMSVRNVGYQAGTELWTSGPGGPVLTEKLEGF